MSNFLEHQKLEFRKSYLRILTALANVDGNIDEKEKEMIYLIGQQRNLKPRQIDEILKERIPLESIAIPENENNRLRLFFDLCRLTFADGKMEESERVMIGSLMARLQIESNKGALILDEVLNCKGPVEQLWHEIKEQIIYSKENAA